MILENCVNFLGAAFVGNAEVWKVAEMTSAESSPLEAWRDLMRSLEKKAVLSSSVSKAVVC